jgi:hypothetical protein
VLNKKDKLKEQRKKSLDEIEAAALASKIDCDNMKRSISEKRAWDGSDNEYSDISNEEQANIHNDDLGESLFNAVGILASLSTSLSSTALLSSGSASPQPTANVLRLHT